MPARSVLTVSSRVFEELPREQPCHEQVVDRLRNRIASGYLRLGDHLPSPRQLSEQLRVSRAIVREAIRVLAAQGLLVVRRGQRGVVVADLTMAYLRSIREWDNEISRETVPDVMTARLIVEV